MFSIGKIFTLIIILLLVWLFFKILANKKKRSKSVDPKKLDAFQCPSCGVWSSEKMCTNQNCTLKK